MARIIFVSHNEEVTSTHSITNKFKSIFLFVNRPEKLNLLLATGDNNHPFVAFHGSRLTG